MQHPDVSPDVVAAAQAGDERAFAQIVELHQRSIFGLAYRMAGDAAQAEDLAQEVFLRVWRKLGSFRTAEPFRPWLLRLATNVCINALKKRRLPLRPARTDEDRDPHEPAAPGPQASEVAERRELLAHMESAIAQLPDDYRLVVTLRHVEGLAYEEIARTLGWPLGTVKVRLFRAREQLREMMRPILGDEP